MMCGHEPMSNEPMSNEPMSNVSAPVFLEELERSGGSVNAALLQATRLRIADARSRVERTASSIIQFWPAVYRCDVQRAQVGVMKDPASALVALVDMLRRRIHKSVNISTQRQDGSLHCLRASTTLVKGAKLAADAHGDRGCRVLR